MKLDDLKLWLIENNLEDQWWIQINGSTLGVRVTLSEIRNDYLGDQNIEVSALHTSQQNIRPRPWLKLEHERPRAEHQHPKEESPIEETAHQEEIIEQSETLDDSHFYAPPPARQKKRGLFGFLKPEVSGFKNVLNGFFAFKARTGFLEEASDEMLRTFAIFYYHQRFGPPLIRDQYRTLMMYNSAMRTAEYVADEEGSWYLTTILKGLLAAEGIDWQEIDYVALRKTLFKFQKIPREISGL